MNLVRLFSLIFVLSYSFVYSAPPILNYAGHVSVNEKPYSGGGLFKFSFINSDNNQTFWSNDGNTSNGSEPLTSVAVQVSGGLYSILLGNTSIPGMSAIDKSIFQNHSNSKLRVWFSDGVNGFQQLRPDRPFASVPFAFTAASAPVKDGSITRNKLSTEVRNELNSTIPRKRLSFDILNELNATIGKSRLSSEILTELNSTQTMVGIVGTDTGIFDSGLKAYLRPVLKSGIYITSAIHGQVAELRAPSVDGRFLKYQWYKNGYPIADANSSIYTISEFNSTRDSGEYEILVSNDFATLKSKAILQENGNATISQANSGHGSSYFVKSDGSLWAVGLNNYGQLGDGTNATRQYLVKIVDANVTKVSAFYHHCLFLKSDGSLWGMGRNYYGELSNYDPNSSKILTPIQIFGSGVSDMAVGLHHSMILKSDGSLWGMGLNAHGQLGDTTTTNHLSPVQITIGVSKVTCGYYHTLFIKNNGSLWAMGNNEYSQLGDLSTTNRSTPVQILSSGVTEIAAGNIHSLFVKTDGSLWSMGYNDKGQLGDNSNTNRSSPVKIENSGVSKVAAGYRSSTYLKTNGSLWGTGYNHVGQLGDGTAMNRNSPVQIQSDGVIEMSRGLYVLYFIKSDNTFWASGWGGHNGLGDGTGINHYSPIQPRLHSIVEQPYVPENIGEILPSQ
jgi:alpha-tubulin suppressor-like RCC1 family protein